MNKIKSIDEEIQKEYNIRLPYLQKELDNLLEKFGTKINYFETKAWLERKGMQFDPIKTNKYVVGMREILKLMEKKVKKISQVDYIRLLGMFGSAVYSDFKGSAIYSDFKRMPLVGSEDGKQFNLGKLLGWVKENANLYPGTVFLNRFKIPLYGVTPDPTLEVIVSKRIPKKIRESGETRTAVNRVLELVQQNDKLADCYYEDENGKLRIYKSKKQEIVSFISKENLREFLKELA
jgi:hypothetical protein